jgi:hypothetical protein
LESVKKQSKPFWSKLKQLESEKNDNAISAITSETGETITEPDLVRERWKTFYQSVYANSLKSDIQNEVHLQVKAWDEEKLDHKIRALDKPVTSEEIKEAIAKLNSNKAPGPDMIPYEFWKSFHERFHPILARLINSMLWKHNWPEQFREGIISPILKNGDTLDTNNYRPITLLNSLMKLCESVIQKRTTDYAESENLLNDEQSGFRDKRSTFDNLFLLREITLLRKSKKEGLVLGFLDVTKAYDTTWRDGVLYKMYRKGIRGNLWKLIRQMNLKVKRRVKIGSELSEEFIAEEGVPQGSKLSPILYDIFIDDLITELNKTGMGIEIGNKKITCLLFADDILLLAKDDQELTHMLKVCEQYAWKWRFRFSAKKSGVVIPNGKLEEGRERQKFAIDDQEIEVKEEYKYLGVEFGKMRRTKNRIEMDSFINRILRDANHCTYKIRHLLCREQGMSIGALVHIFKTQVRPILEYATPLFNSDLTSDQVEKLEQVQTTFGKRILKLPTFTPNFVVYGELDLQPLAMRREELALRNGARILTHKGRWTKEVWKQTEKTPNSFAKLFWESAQRFKLMEEAKRLEQDGCTLEEWTSLVKKKAKERWLEEWARLTKAKLYALTKPSPKLSESFSQKAESLQWLVGMSETKNKIRRQQTNRRTNSKTNVEECDYCDEISSTNHLLFECEHWEERRSELKKEISRILNSCNLPEIARMINAELEEKIQPKMAAFLLTGDTSLLVQKDRRTAYEKEQMAKDIRSTTLNFLRRTEPED